MSMGIWDGTFCNTSLTKTCKESLLVQSVYDYAKILVKSSIVHIYDGELLINIFKARKYAYYSIKIRVSRTYELKTKATMKHFINGLKYTRAPIVVKS